MAITLLTIEVGRIGRDDHVVESPDPQVGNHKDWTRNLTAFICRDLLWPLSVHDLVSVPDCKYTSRESGIVCFIQGAIELDQSFYRVVTNDLSLVKRSLSCLALIFSTYAIFAADDETRKLRGLALLTLSSSKWSITYHDFHKWRHPSLGGVGQIGLVHRLQKTKVFIAERGWRGVERM